MTLSAFRGSQLFELNKNSEGEFYAQLQNSFKNIVILIIGGRGGGIFFLLSSKEHLISVSRKRSEPLATVTV